jgi:putative MATE family efflux protein
MAHTKSSVSKFEMLTTYPVEQLVIQMAIPTIIIMMISALYNVADTYFVSSLGTSATGAVGISFSLMAIIQAIGFFFGNGTGNYISRALGAQKTADAEKMAATGFFTAFFLGVILSACGLIFLTPLARILGSTATILPYARDYLRFILLGMPFMVSSLVLNNLLRFEGSALFGMIGMTSGALLNIGLDMLFIFVFHWGVSGAAFATMISQTVSCVLLFIISNTSKQAIRVLPKNFSPHFSNYKEMLRGGTPSLLRQSLVSLSTIILNHAAGGFGDAAIAAISIVNRIFLMASSALLGLGQGFQPVCGFNYGAKLYARVKKAFWFCMRIATILLCALAVLCFIFAPHIIALFRKDDPAVIAIGTLALRFQCFSYPFGAWIILNNMLLQTIGKAIPASILAFARQGLFLIPLILILVPMLGVLGIQLCIPIADFCTFLLAVPLGVTVLKKDLKT